MDKDPDDTETRPDADGSKVARRPSTPGGGGGPGGLRPGGAAAAVKATEPKIDWAGLKRRTRQVTTTGSVFSGLHRGQRRQDSLIFVASEEGGGGGRGGPGGLGAGGGGGGAPSIYSIQDDGKRMSRITSGTPAVATEDDADRPRGGRGASAAAACPTSV